jgi:hypothetical protein
MSTQYLLDTILETFSRELQRNYEAQLHRNVDIIKANGTAFSSLIRPNEVTVQSLDNFVKLFSEVHEKFPLPRTMAAVSIFAGAVRQNL